MAKIAVRVDINATPEVVWADVSNLASHVEWMADAEAIEFLSVQTAGLGVRMRVATRVGPFRTADVMEVTQWDPPRVIAVSHGTAAVGQGPHAAEEAGDGGPRPGRKNGTAAVGQGPHAAEEAGDGGPRPGRKNGTAAVGQGPHAAEEAGDGGPRPGRKNGTAAVGQGPHAAEEAGDGGPRPGRKNGTAAVGQGPHAAEEAGDGGPRPGRKNGLFTGRGRFVLEPIDRGTRFRWEEEIRFPWYLGGPIGAWVARPVLSGIWQRNLRRFAARFV